VVRNLLNGERRMKLWHCLRQGGGDRTPPRVDGLLDMLYGVGKSVKRGRIEIKRPRQLSVDAGLRAIVTSGFQPSVNLKGGLRGQSLTKRYSQYPPASRHKVVKEKRKGTEADEQSAEGRKRF